MLNVGHTPARITDDIKRQAWTGSRFARAPAIQALLETGALRLSLFD